MDWNSYFMNLAHAVSQRSKDPTTKVGAVLVDKNNHVIGTGYNGMPPGIPEETLWKDRETKYKYVIHAEANCLLHAVSGTKGAVLYCTLTPCAECMKLIASAGVSKVFYRDEREDIVRTHIAELCGIGMEKV